MKITKIILIAIALFVTVSCGDQLAELNVDPNESSTGGEGPEVFTSATGYYGLALDAFFNEDNALFAQYVAGGPGVALLDLVVECLRFGLERIFQRLIGRWLRLDAHDRSPAAPGIRARGPGQSTSIFARNARPHTRALGADVSTIPCP